MRPSDIPTFFKFRRNIRQIRRQVRIEQRKLLDLLYAFDKLGTGIYENDEMRKDVKNEIVGYIDNSRVEVTYLRETLEEGKNEYRIWLCDLEVLNTIRLKKLRY